MLSHPSRPERPNSVGHEKREDDHEKPRSCQACRRRCAGHCSVDAPRIGPAAPDVVPGCAYRRVGSIVRAPAEVLEVAIVRVVAALFLAIDRGDVCLPVLNLLLQHRPHFLKKLDG